MHEHAGVAEDGDRAGEDRLAEVGGEQAHAEAGDDGVDGALVAGGGEEVVEVGGGAVDGDQARVGEAAGGGFEEGSVDLDGVEFGVGGHGREQGFGDGAGAGAELDDRAGAPDRGALHDRVDQKSRAGDEGGGLIPVAKRVGKEPPDGLETVERGGHGRRDCNGIPANVTCARARARVLTCPPS